MSRVAAFHTPPVSSQRWLLQTYFSNPDKRRFIAKGDYLFRQGEYNDRLYLVLSGSFIGVSSMPDGTKYETFKAVQNTFVGVISFFSKTYVSNSDVIAMEDSEVAYIDQCIEPVYDGNTRSLAEQFMPVIIAELIHRQHRIQRIAQEKEKATRSLIRAEKMASLGQISAGVAHELNNAVAVIKRQGEWICEYMRELMQEARPDMIPFFVTGREHGRKMSTREVRRRAEELQRAFRIKASEAKRLAETGVTDEALSPFLGSFRRSTGEIVHAWEIGAAIHDLQVAAEHAVHVVRGIKTLGAQQSKREPGLDINACVDEALTLLSSPLRSIQIEYELQPDLPLILGNKGEIVQILINLVRNACEAHTGAKTEEPRITITTAAEDDCVSIQVRDNGPGIPPSLLPHIFEPRLTTKTGAQTVGLGLGLAIVQQLVDSYGGTVTAQSQPGDTIFTIRIPAGGRT